MALALVVAIAENGVIGRDNRLPWHIPEDLKRFKALTLGHPIIMGRRTYESIGRPLPGRRNIVVTRNPDWRADGVESAGGLAAAVGLAAADATIFVIGGASLFAEALPQAAILHLTRIHRAYEGDVHFPPLDLSGWRETAREDRAGDPPYSFVTLEHR